MQIEPHYSKWGSVCIAIMSVCNMNQNIFTYQYPRKHGFRLFYLRFDLVFSFICGRHWVAVARHLMICLVCDQDVTHSNWLAMPWLYIYPLNILSHYWLSNRVFRIRTLTFSIPFLFLLKIRHFFRHKKYFLASTYFSTFWSLLFNFLNYIV